MLWSHPFTLHTAIRSVAPSLPWIGGAPPCYAVFSQLTLHRERRSYGATSASGAREWLAFRFVCCLGQDVGQHDPSVVWIEACAPGGPQIRMGVLELGALETRFLEVGAVKFRPLELRAVEVRVLKFGS